ncbi:MAG TPA: C25 family cysteine peptidase, partial [Anaerolineaceae bacterium]|nr:C25 family cysteine peptidase [Anaerolineaceae bacterium]
MIKNTKWILTLVTLLFVIGLMLPAKASGEGVRTAEASRLLDEESTGVRFTVTVPVEELELEEIEENGKTYTRVGLPGWSQTAQAGAPSLPLVVEQVGAPLGAEVTLYVVPGQARVEKLSAPVLPVVTQRAEMKPPVEGEPLLPEMVYVVEEDASVYGGGEYPGSLAIVMNDGMVRQQRVLGVVVYPVQYNAQRQELTVYETLEVEVRFGGGGFEGGEAEDSAAYESVLEGELLNYESAQSWRASPLEAEGRMSPLGLTGAGVPWAPPEPGWRVKVRNDGVYRLSYAELVAAGLPVSSLDPRTIKMYNLGKELAIRVVGEGDGEFNSTDYIVFYGEGLDSKYTWDNIYWLTYGGDNGRRMGTRNGTPGAGSTPGWHVSNLHIEENTYYFSNAPGSDDLERYFGAFLYPPSIPSWTKTFTLDAPANAAGQMTISMIGYLANAINPDHHVRVTLNGEQIGDVYWDGVTWSNLSMPLRAGLLKAGENTLVVTAVNDTGVGSDMLYIDAVDVEYANTFTAVGDELWFKNGAAGVYRYRLNGFTTGQVEVYDVTDAENVEQISNLAVSGSNPYMVEFSDVAGGAGQYLAKAAGSYKAVQGIETVDTASNLRGVGNGADHIIITPRAFWEQAETLRAHRAGQGLRAVKVDLQDVYDEFNYGIASAEAIRDFLEYTYNAWVKPSPSYVVLMGDGHFDAKNYQNLGKVNYIPPYLAFVDPWLGETAADNRYVTFKDRMGNRDAMPDMMLGRMAVNSAAEAAAMVNKTIAYEANPAEPWQQQVLAVADNRDSGGLFDLLSDSLLAGHLPAPYTAEKVYLNVTHMTAADAKTAILAGINSGKLLVNYIGHASRTDWATEKLFGVADVKNLANGSKQPIILGMTCYDGYYQMPYLSDYFATAEVVTRGAKFDGAEDKGAVASWSPSGLGVASGHDRLNRGFFDALLTDGVETLGQATYAGKAELWASGTNYDLLETFLLFGDPALRVNRVPALKVSGNITTPSGGPFSGVEVSTTLANGQIRKATSNVDGKFLFNGLPRGEYVFTPLMTGYNFNPAASAPQVLDDSDLSGVNFTSSLAPIFSISGTVKDYQGQVLDDVTVSIDNGQAPVVTQSDGKYAFGELTLGTYQVSVSRAGYLFPVPSQSVTISGVSRTNINFSGLPLHSISGRITYNGAPLPGVTVDDALGHTALSGVDGTYLFEDLTPEVYTLTPSLEGYAFVPGSRQVTLSAVDVPGMNFSADKLGVNDPPLVLDIPDQQIVEGETFTTINLDDYVVDVDNPVEEIEWTFTGNTDLNVNITNRVATITLPHADWFGSEVITFRATDSDGLYGEDAVTFTVTPVNDAPVMVENIPDQWVIHGAAFAPIELDRYISDVDNSADEINWSVAGDTNLDVTIIDRVATITQREANWSGSETVTFRGTDPEGLFAEQPVNFDVVAVKPTVGQKLTAKRVTFEWSGITNANQYNVQLSLSDTFDKILLNATTSNLRFAYGSDLANGKTYYWRIRPRFGTTWGDWSTVKTSDQKPLEFLSMNPPLAPTLKAPAAGAFLRVKDVDFDWTDVVNADHYQLQISKTTAFKDPNTYYPQPGDQPFTVHDLQDGLYYWRIRAIDEVDVAGGWSATRSFTVDTIAPAAPALIAPLAGAYTYDTTPTLAVKAVPGATWYRYRVVTKAEGEPATCEQNVVLTSDKLNKTSWSTMTPELPYGDTYYWCAQAVDAAENESPWSESEARQITITLQNLPKPGTETMVRTPAFSWFA